jgi:hypothetical protein
MTHDVRAISTPGPQELVIFGKKHSFGSLFLFE